MKRTGPNRLDPKHPQYEQTASQVRDVMTSGDYAAFGELLEGYIAGDIEINDVVAEILSEENWTEGDKENEERFEAPPFAINNVATTMENGMTFKTARIVQNRVWVNPEYLATPEYPVDTDDLKKGNIVTVETINRLANLCLIVAKVKRMYDLLGDGDVMTDTAATGSRLYVIKDAASFSEGTDNPLYIRELKRKLKDIVSKLQEKIGGYPQIKGFCRQVTYDLVVAAEVNTNVEWHPIPAASDPDTSRPYFTEGDIFLVGPGAANVAQIKAVTADETHPKSFEVRYAFRWGHKWIRWTTDYLARIVIVPTAASEAKPTMEVDAFNSAEMDLYFTKPIKKSTITNANIVLTDLDDGNSTLAWTVAATDGVDVAADLRHVHITFGSTAPTAGHNYKIAVTTNLLDLGDVAFAAADVVASIEA